MQITKMTYLLTGLTLALVGCSVPHTTLQIPLLESSIGGTSQSAPVLKITSIELDASDRNYVIVKGMCSKGTTISFSGSGLQGVSTVSCASDSFQSRLPRTIGDGEKGIIASCSSGGKTTTDSKSLVIDSTAPVLMLTGPAALTPTRSYIDLIGTCETGLSVLVDGGISVAGEVACVNGTFSTRVTLQSGDGAKEVRIRQIDASQNTTEIKRSFLLDTIAPAIVISSPQAAALVNSVFRVSGTCETGLSVKIEGAGLAASSAVACVSATFSADVSVTKGDGVKAFSVSQTDAAGNASVANLSVTNKATGPQIAITEPAALSMFQTSLALKGTCQTGLNVQISGAGVATPGSVACTSGAFSSTVQLSTGDGMKAIQVSQTDSLQNTGTDIRTFVKDSVAPLLQITQPAQGTPTKSAISLQGTCETGLVVQVSGTGVASASSVNCLSGTFSASLTLSGTDGNKDIQVLQADPAGNSSTVTRSFVKDTTAPTIQITSPLANAQLADAAVKIAGSCEGSGNVQLLGAGLKSTQSFACANGTFSVDATLSDGDGTKVLTAQQTDGAGNVGQHSIQVVRATPAPVLDGKILYAQNCATCHGALDVSVKIGRTAAQITQAIFGSASAPGMPAMAGLKGLTADQITAISNALQPTVVGPGQTTNPFACADPSKPQVLATAMVRLTKQQLMNTYLGILGSTIYNTVVGDFAGLQPDNLSTPATQYTPEEISSLKDIAVKVADTVTGNSTNLKAIVGSCAGTSVTEACAGTFVDSFGLKALRRTPTATEKSNLIAIFKAYSNSLDGVNAMIRYFLQAPQLFYHLELGNDSDSTPNTSPFLITQFEVASRMSYIVTDSVPDATLLQLASSAQLTGTQLSTQMDRLLASTEGKKKIRSFYDAWLKIAPVTQLGTYPAALVNGLNLNGLAAEMQRELDQYIEQMVFTDKASYASFLTSKRSFAQTAALAQIYGHTLASSTSTVQTMGGDRKGILMRAPFLLNYDDGTHPILRGVRIQKNILCTDIGDPPAVLDNPNVPADLSLATYSSRDFYTYRTNASSCLGCHGQINPPGFLFEGYDALGRARTAEGRYDTQGKEIRSFQVVTAVDKLTIDAGGRESFANVSEFIDELAASQRGPSCFVRQAFRYYQKRRETTADSCVLQPMYQKVIGSSGSMLEAIRNGILNNNLQYKMVRQ